MEQIYKRRSVRKFLNKPISDDDLDALLMAGMNAPSAHNLKPYEFVLVKDRNTLNALADACIYSKMLSEAAAAIVVVSKGDDEKTPYWQADCAAVTENILLEAISMEIGSCWLGGYPDLEKTAKEKEILAVPQDYQIFSVIALGYSALDLKPNDNYYPEKIHYEKY